MDDLSWLRAVSAQTTGEPLALAQAAGWTAEQLLGIWAAVREMHEAGTVPLT